MAAGRQATASVKARVAVRYFNLFCVTINYNILALRAPHIRVSGGHRRVGVVLLPGRLTSTHTVVCEPRAVRATFYYMRGAGGPSFTFGVKVRKSPITSKCTAVVHAQYVFRSLPARQNAKSRTRKTHTAHRELIDTVHEELFTREILYYDRVSDGTL